METNIIGKQDLSESKESLKLIKNSRGYNWEIKVHIEDSNDLKALERIEELNNQIVIKFQEDKNDNGL